MLAISIHNYDILELVVWRLLDDNNLDNLTQVSAKLHMCMEIKFALLFTLAYLIYHLCEIIILKIMIIIKNNG